MIVILLIFTTAFILLTLSGQTIGAKNYVIACIINGIGIFAFLVAFEEYALTMSGFPERRASILLSCLYMLILELLGNWLLMQSAWFSGMAALLAIVLLAALMAANYGFYHFFHDSQLFQKQKLLVIGGGNANFFRMKRMKYGTLSQFDSWYESLELEDPASLHKIIHEDMPKYDAVCIFDNLKDDIYEQVVKQALLLNKEVYAVPKVIDINRNQANYVRFDDILTFHIQKYALSPVEEAVKRAFDLVSSLIALMIVAIPMLIIAIAVKITSPGPVFYRQLRYTKNKKEFYIFKFRTMIPDAEKYSGPTFAQKDDPRITKIGKILRACRLDELPQLFNIIKGDMSVVGPRPERPFFVEQFEKEIDNYNYRFVVKAGLTSLSHVYGRYSTYIHDRTCYDLLYISNYSFLMDLKIILLTTKTMLMKDAAEGEDEFKQSANPNQKKEEANK